MEKMVGGLIGKVGGGGDSVGGCGERCGGGGGFVVLGGSSSRESKKAWGKVGGVENKSSLGSKLMSEKVKGFSFEGFSYNIGYVVLEGDLINGDVPLLDIVTKEVMMDFNMFGTRMENRIFLSGNIFGFGGGNGYDGLLLGEPRCKETSHECAHTAFAFAIDVVSHMIEVGKDNDGRFWELLEKGA
uniref:Uncharacterized protein n=1 Tax=Tanacetum cinerariifolium TaxID=118510 RepID=A0A6L2M384_TANCI|nr:hypothetical protein [Tanacetum cinerariifolium]